MTLQNDLSAFKSIPNIPNVIVNDLPGYIMKFFSNMDKGAKKPSTDDNDNDYDEAKEIATAYKYILVMPKGDRNLDSIFRSERPGIDAVRVLMREVALSLQSLHEQKLIHGDIKMLNIVRETHSNRLRLIDLDAAANISECISSKFSSGILAPEAIHFLQKDDIQNKSEIETLKKDIKELEDRGKKNVSLWDSHGENAFIIKNMFEDESINGKQVCNILGVESLKASENLDVWAFGVLLYRLCTGEASL